MKSIVISLQCFFYCLLLLFTNTALSGEKEYRQKVNDLCKLLSDSPDKEQKLLVPLKEKGRQAGSEQEGPDKDPQRKPMKFLSLKELEKQYADNDEIQESIREIVDELIDARELREPSYILSNAGFEWVFHDKLENTEAHTPLFCHSIRTSPIPAHRSTGPQTKEKVFSVYSGGLLQELTLDAIKRQQGALIRFKLLSELQARKYKGTLTPQQTKGLRGISDQALAVDEPTVDMAKESKIDTMDIIDDMEFFTPEIFLEIVADNGATDYIELPWAKEGKDLTPTEEHSVFVNWTKLDAANPKQKALNVHVRMVELDGFTFDFRPLIKFAQSLLIAVINAITPDSSVANIAREVTNGIKDLNLKVTDQDDLVDLMVITRPTKAKYSEEKLPSQTITGDNKNMTVTLTPVF